MMLGTHRDEPTTRDIEDQVVFRGKSHQGILGLVVLWMWRIEEIYGNGSCIRRRLRAWQEDLMTKRNRLLMTNKLKLMNKLTIAAGRATQGVHTKGLLVFSQVTRSISTVGAARNFRS